MGDPVAECGCLPCKEIERNRGQNPLESYARRKNKKPDKMIETISPGSSENSVSN